MGRDSGVKSTLRGEEGEGKGRLQPGATDDVSAHTGLWRTRFPPSVTGGGGENRDTQRAPLTLGSESIGNLKVTEQGRSLGMKEPGGFHVSLEGVTRETRTDLCLE